MARGGEGLGVGVEVGVEASGRVGGKEDREEGTLGYKDRQGNG